MMEKMTSEAEVTERFQRIVDRWCEDYDATTLPTDLLAAELLNSFRPGDSLGGGLMVSWASFTDNWKAEPEKP